MSELTAEPTAGQNDFNPDYGWQAIASSAVEKAAYDSKTKTLRVEFKDTGKTYEYADVPKSTFTSLTFHSSPGKYIKQITAMHKGRLIPS